MKMVLVAASREQKLFECTQMSLLKAAMQSAELGLDCSGTLGQAYLVPFFNNKIRASEAVFIPGYRGLIELARRGGQIASIEAHCVFEHDEFVYELGTSRHIRHVPRLRGDRGELLCVWAMGVLRDGSQQAEMMTRQQIDAIRARSKAGESGPWKTDYHEMARKTVVKRICKYLPLTAELQRAIEIDDEATGYADIVVDATKQEVPGAADVTKRLADRFGDAGETPEPEQPKRRPGRPAGSKNKPKEPIPAKAPKDTGPEDAVQEPDFWEDVKEPGEPVAEWLKCPKCSTPFRPALFDGNTTCPGCEVEGVACDGTE